MSIFNEYKWTIIVVAIAICVIIVGVVFLLPHKNPLTGRVNPVSYGVGCELAGECNGIVGVNCHAEVDGPFYYVDGATGKIIGNCGGLCMGGDGVTNCKPDTCPPPQWTCAKK